MPEKQYLRVDEVCDRLACARSTVYQMVRDGRLPAHRPLHRLLIPRESVERFLEKSKIKNE